VLGGGSVVGGWCVGVGWGGWVWGGGGGGCGLGGGLVQIVPPGSLP